MSYIGGAAVAVAGTATGGAGSPSVLLVAASYGMGASCGAPVTYIVPYNTTTGAIAGAPLQLLQYPDVGTGGAVIAIPVPAARAADSTSAPSASFLVRTTLSWGTYNSYLAAYAWTPLTGFTPTWAADGSVSGTGIAGSGGCYGQDEYAVQATTLLAADGSGHLVLMDGNGIQVWAPQA
jgi:hypothetical protein